VLNAYFPKAKIIDMRKEDLVNCVLKETGGLGVDCFVDSDGTMELEKCLPFMATHSKFLTPNPKRTVNRGTITDLFSLH
jgi:NADPH:quinone reductase-like Zn-dependent oxidoreductase